MLSFDVHSQGTQKAVGIVLEHIELVLGEILNVSVLFSTLGVNECELFLSEMVKTEIVTEFPRVFGVLTVGTELQRFKISLSNSNVTLAS